jgi:4-amino-4-deoxy-L-arabinose transferase-like glycosyltransferase
VSSAIISTDVPLLASWALALFAFAALLQKPEARWPALILGLALGLGLNAKYAMAWFVLLTAIYGVARPDDGWRLLRDWRAWAALAIGVVLIAPNIAWNAQHRFATFSHTAENANWHGIPFHPDKALEFLAGQLGVFGPVLFVALAMWAWRLRRVARLERADALLAAFSLPLIAIMLVQAFLSRAHANWAAVAYVAASVLVIANLVRAAEHRWLRASFAVNVAVVPLLALSAALAGSLALPLVGDPYARTLGWRALADATRAKLAQARTAGHPYAAVLTDDRAITAELLYYMQGEATPVVAWLTPGAAPHDHFELTRPYRPSVGEPVLLVATRSKAEEVVGAFARDETVATETLSAGRHATRAVAFHALSGYKAQ